MKSRQKMMQSSTKQSLGTTLRKDFKRNYNVYIMVLPVIIYYILFMYKPMYGVLMAFQDFAPRKGISGSEWVGLANFIDFFRTDSFGRIFKNTLVISISSIIFCFPAGIIFALLLNEIKSKYAKSIVQTCSYLPHFISLVVICGMIKAFTMDTGVINYIIGLFGGEKTTMLNNPSMFLPIYLISDIWQNVGWNSIIFVAAMSGIDQSLYEAADLDGANRWQKVVNVTVPSIMPTIITLLILRVDFYICIQTWTCRFEMEL